QAPVLALEAKSFDSDSPDARATAGFLLNQAWEGLSPDQAAHAQDTARAALADAGSSSRLREESLGMLGHPGASDRDVGLIENALLGSPEEAVRGRALHALVESGAPAARMKPVLERALADPRTSEPLQRAIKAQLGR